MAACSAQKTYSRCIQVKVQMQKNVRIQEHLRATSVFPVFSAADVTDSEAEGRLLVRKSPASGLAGRRSSRSTADQLLIDALSQDFMIPQMKAVLQVHAF